jgi:hypothetical protein
MLYSSRCPWARTFLPFQNSRLARSSVRKSLGKGDLRHPFARPFESKEWLVGCGIWIIWFSKRDASALAMTCSSGSIGIHSHDSESWRNQDLPPTSDKEVETSFKWHQLQVHLIGTSAAYEDRRHAVVPTPDSITWQKNEGVKIVLRSKTEENSSWNSWQNCEHERTSWEKVTP